MLPAISVYASYPQLFESLGKLDEEVTLVKNSSGNVDKASMYLALARPFLAVNTELTDPLLVFNDFLRQIKVIISPITPSNYDLEKAASEYMKEQGMKVPKGAVRHRNPELPVQRPQRPRHSGKPGENPSPRKHRRHAPKKYVQDHA